MITKDYLLEIGCEEIPARFMPGLLDDLKTQITNQLALQRFSFEEVITYGTYRRLTVIVKDLSDKQDDLHQKIKGPPAKIAIDENGKFLMPAIGFAKKNHLAVENLLVEDEKGTSYIFATINEIGKTVKDVFPSLIFDILGKMQLPIAMRWGSNKSSFIRPVHWIVSLYGKEIIPFTFFDITAARTSFGHRFMTQNKNIETIASGAPIEISSVDEYISKLEENHIILDQAIRKNIILDFLNKNIDKNAIDQELVDEVVFLVEKPVALTGTFNNNYLDLPSEPLIQCMKKHQKFFPVIKKGKLESKFIVIADNVTDKSLNNIILGNESVLTARLEDVKYFWQEDIKAKLDAQSLRLKHVVFQKGLGSIYDKVKRIENISEFLIKTLNLKEFEQHILQTASLCKSDLVSNMVFELPALQGTMGRLYAEQEGFEQTVALGIEEHYLPRFHGDILPETQTGIIVGLADKFDTIVCCFYNNLIPTGSQDPWGVRRAIYAILQIVYKNDISINFESCIDHVYALLGESINKDKLLSFFQHRIKSFLIDHELSYDVVDAVLDNSMQQFLTSMEIAKSIQATKKGYPEEFKGIVETAVRIKRIAKKYEAGEVDVSLFKEDIENISWKLYCSIIDNLNDSLIKEDYNKQLSEILPELTPQMTAYFDQILIMADDNALKQNRLAFLHKLDQIYSSFSDFEKIVIN
jgi:glycyl-tRNA synthetase beta chain